MTGPDRPVRVLEVTARFLPELGGVETHTYEVSRRLGTEPDLDVTVFATDRTGTMPATEAGEGFAIVRRPAHPRSRDWFVVPGLPAVIRDGGWDVVHFQGVHTLVPVLGMLAARRAGLPYLLTFHTGGSSSGVRTRFRDTQWRLLAPLLRGAVRLVAVSRFEKRLFEDATGIPGERFTVIRNGGALPPVPPGVSVVPGRLVSVGRLERYKGHHRAIEALAVLRRTDDRAHLVVLGTGPYEPDLWALAADLGVADAVDIRSVPPRDRSAMAAQIGAAAVVVALSDYEAHPVAVMEALTLGVPVLGLDTAGTADLVEDGTVTGIAPGTSAEDTAAVLRTLLATPTPGGRHAPATGLPTWEQSAQALAQLYRTVAGRPEAPAHGSPAPVPSTASAPVTGATG